LATARRPDAVLWDQPPSAANRNAYADQDFESRQDVLDIALADDFSNAEAWHIDAISVPGDTYNSGCDLSCADRFTWEIYGDKGGIPAGDPWGGGSLPYWWSTLAPGDAQVTLGTGAGGWLSNVTLTLDTPAYLPPGTWWLVFLPSLNSESCGCEYGRHVSDTANGHVAQVVNPRAGWGFPTSWTSIQDASTWGLAEQDLVFRLQGVELHSLGNRVWYDTDQDGLQDAGEPGAQGIDVDLYENAGCTGAAVASDTTDAAGAYGFEEQRPGTYCLQFSGIPAGWLLSPPDQGSDESADSDADPATGRIEDVSLGADNLDEDVGLYVEGSIGNTVWCEPYGNGQYDPGEGLAGITVRLFEDPECDAVPGALWGSEETVGDGQYLFSGLQVGPAGSPTCYVSEVDVGDMGECSAPLTPFAYDAALDVDSPDDLGHDFGFTWILDLGDWVWYDADRDGIQDAGEPGVEGISVDLYDDGDCAGTPIASETTAADGSYDFLGLAPGTYCLQFSGLLPSWRFSARGQGGDEALDSDVDPSTGQIRDIELQAEDLDQDAGLYAEGSIGDTVWCDANANTLFDPGEGVDGVTVSLYEDGDCNDSADGLLTTKDTAGDGQYLFDGLHVGSVGNPTCYLVGVDASDMGLCSKPLGSVLQEVALDSYDSDDLSIDFGFTWILEIGDLVWYDTDQDGRQDGDEVGVGAIGVDLYNNGGCTGSPMLSQATDAQGEYFFEELPPGTYCLQFHDIPGGWQISPPNLGPDDGHDSDADPATAQINDVELSEDDFGQDMGLYVEGSVGGAAWCDADHDGLHSAGEGAAGVTVKLYDDDGCDGEANGMQLSQDTQSDGQYIFDGLLTGSPGSPICFLVEVDAGAMSDCGDPFTPTTYAVALDAESPGVLDKDFGFEPDWLIFLPWVAKGR
jgi:hypothetical protein